MSQRQPYGNVKLRGKRQRLLSCGCCVAENRKLKTLERETLREIRRRLQEKISEK